MRRTATLMFVGALGLATVSSAVADKAARPGKPPNTPAAQKQPKTKPANPKPPKPKVPKPDKCVAHNAGYGAMGTLVSSALTSTGPGSYSGTLEAALTKANHGASTGKQHFTLASVKVKFHHPVGNPAPAGSAVKVKGTITELPKQCPTAGFTATITLKEVDIGPAKPPKH